MITEIRKKLAKELSLVIAERAREESVNATDLWKKPVSFIKYIYPPHSEVYLIQNSKCLQRYISPSWRGVLDTTFKMSSNISIPLMVRCTWYNIQNVFKYIYPPHGEMYLIQLSKCFQIYISPSCWDVLDTTFKMSTNISIPLMVRCTWYNIQNVFKYIYPPHGEVYLIQHSKCLQIYLSPSWWGVLDTTFKMSSKISIPLMVRCTWYNIQNVFKDIYPPHGEVYLIQHSKCL